MRALPLLRALPFLLAIAYPGLVYAGLELASARTVAVLLAVALAARLLATRLLRVRPDRSLAPAPGRAAGSPALRLSIPVALVLIILGAAALADDRRLLLAVPVLMSAGMLAAFGWTLLRPPSLVETIARTQVAWLSAAEVVYCRRVTLVWCGFFVANGAIAGGLAAAGAVQAWTVYCGLVAYGLMGALFAGEHVYRAWRFRRYTGAPADALLRRLFPPRSEP